MIKGAAEKLARGGQSAKYSQTAENDIAHDLSLGLPETEVTSKYSMTSDEYKKAMILYMQGDDHLLLQFDHRVTESETSTPLPEETIEFLPEIKAEYGYQAFPRHKQVFIKRVTKEHTSRLIKPPAYEDDTDIGTIFALGDEVTGLEKNQLVLFDKFAVDGPEFHLLDEDGDDVSLVRVLEIHVIAVLKKTKRKDA